MIGELFVLSRGNFASKAILDIIQAHSQYKRVDVSEVFRGSQADVP